MSDGQQQLMVGNMEMCMEYSLNYVENSPEKGIWQRRNFHKYLLYCIDKVG